MDATRRASGGGGAAAAGVASSARTHAVAAPILPGVIPALLIIPVSFARAVGDDGADPHPGR